jgi:flagellar motor switch protein FliN/FliY
VAGGAGRRRRRAAAGSFAGELKESGRCAAAWRDFRTFEQLMPVMHGKPPASTSEELKRILRMEVPVIVKLADRKILLSEVLRLGVGAIVEFTKRSDQPLELLINNKVIGVGETVKVGENFGLRITQIGDVKQIIDSLGSAKR